MKAGLGCLILPAVPAVMIVCIISWQGRNPQALRSTSGLDFVFGPIWPSLGAIVGFAAGTLLRSALKKP